MPRYPKTILPRPSPSLSQYHSSESPNLTITSPPPGHVSCLPSKAQVPLSTRPRYFSNQSSPSTSSPMFPPRIDSLSRSIYYLRDAAETDKTIFQFRDVLNGHIGFDIEYRPSFIKGQPLNKTALIQLASPSIAFLIQVSAMSEFPDSIRVILQDPTIIKVGVGIQGDVKKLWDDYRISMNGSLELGYLARAVDPQWSTSRGLISLARLAKAYQGQVFKKPKNIQMSNWELILTESQQNYAANDAFIAMTIFNKLNTILASVEPPPDKGTYLFRVL